MSNVLSRSPGLAPGFSFLRTILASVRLRRDSALLRDSCAVAHPPASSAWLRSGESNPARARLFCSHPYAHASPALSGPPWTAALSVGWLLQLAPVLRPGWQLRAPVGVCAITSRTRLRVPHLNANSRPLAVQVARLPEGHGFSALPVTTLKRFSARMVQDRSVRTERR